jgi:4-hydroxy-4-methyl-2-oxoglutarate aldolase
MRRWIVYSIALAVLAPAALLAQLGMFTNEQRIDITREWKGERYPDGRPRVPDEVLERLKSTTAEEAWGSVSMRGYRHQYEGGWKTINVKPGERLVGRAVTAQFMPHRPDMDAVIKDHARREGRVGSGQNSWVIDTLVTGDVLVVDLFGKIKDGTIIGDNLASSIMTKTGAGLVVDGAVRDVSGISEIAGFKVYARDFHPSFLTETTLMGWNLPIRIGDVTVIPGDIVLSDPEGIVFIPAPLAEAVANESEMTRLRDEWGKKMLREQKYAPGQVDGQWTPQMVEEFNKYAAEKGSKIRMNVPAKKQN